MFSNSTQYAIRTAIYLLRHNVEQKRFKVGDLARELDIPRAYLSKILQLLSRKKLLSSSKGRGGGFFLSDENLKNSLTDFIVCLDGDQVFKYCILGATECNPNNPCHLHIEHENIKIALNIPLGDIVL